MAKSEKEFTFSIQLFVRFSTKVFLGCLQAVRFTEFLAETVFWELSFFIRNDSKLAFLEKFFETCFVYFATLPMQLTTIKCFQKKTKNGLKNFQNSPLFVLFWSKQDNHCYFILPKKSVKRTICRQHRKTNLNNLW